VTLAPAHTGLDALLHTVDGELERWHVPGLELAAVRDGLPAFAGGFGVRGVADPTPVAATTLFHHGSCGKAYTGLVAALLAEDGLVDLDAPVRQYVPELRLPDEVVAARVTTRDLLSHRSGIGRHDLAWIFNPSWTPEEVLGRLEHFPMVGDLRAQWSYSNFGYALAGVVLSRVTGLSYADALRSRVLAPIGMSRTGLAGELLPGDDDCARPHVLRDDRPAETLTRLVQGIAPAGELVSCADDSIKWLRTQLGVDPAVPAAAITATHEPSMLVPSGVSPFPELAFHGYGFGWLKGTYRGHRLVWHNGGVDGFCSQTLLLPDERSGVIVSGNLHSTNFPFAVALAAADALLAVSAEVSWFDVLRPGDGDAVAADEQSDASAPRLADDAPSAPSRPLSAYAGTYVERGYGRLVVSVDGGELTARFGEFDIELVHRDGDTWGLSYPPLDVTGSLHFERDGADGVAAACATFDADGTDLRLMRDRGDDR
jgi:CubicO group peptidase (beta-lactamase class C family)